VLAADILGVLLLMHFSKNFYVAGREIAV